MKRIFVILITFVISSTTISAQTLDETLTSLAEDVATSYVQPITSAFGSNLNSGWFNGVPDDEILGFDFELKFVGIGSIFSDENRTFSASSNFRFTGTQVDQILSDNGYSSSHPAYSAMRNEMLSVGYNVSVSGPTIVGSKDEHMVIEFGGATVQGNTLGAETIDVDGVTGLLEDLPVLPSGAIQLGLGTVYGTQLSIRWFPEMDLQDVGKVNFFGFGLMHNPEVWFPNPIPIDFAVGFFSQKLTVGDTFESTALQYGAFASKTFGIGLSITPYIGLTMESATTTLTYNYTLDTPAGSSSSSVSFDLNGENDLGVTLGARLNIFALNLSADYKLANTNTATVALSFGF